MLFRREENNINLNKYIEKQWENLQIFLQEMDLKKQHFLSSNGFYSYIEKGQFSKSLGLFFFTIDSQIIGFLCSSLAENLQLAKEYDEMKLEKIFLFKSNIKQSIIFEENQFKSRSSNYYHNFDVDLPVEIQFFDYEKEQKILFSKPGEGNINLYFSFLYNKNNQVFKTTKTESLKKEIKNLYMVKVLDERMSLLKKE